MIEEPQFKYLTAGCHFKNDTFVIALNRFDYPITILFNCKTNERIKSK